MTQEKHSKPEVLFWTGNEVRVMSRASSRVAELTHVIQMLTQKKKKNHPRSCLSIFVARDRQSNSSRIPVRGRVCAAEEGAGALCEFWKWILLIRALALIPVSWIPDASKFCQVERTCVHRCALQEGTKKTWQNLVNALVMQMSQHLFQIHELALEHFQKCMFLPKTSRRCGRL